MNDEDPDLPEYMTPLYLAVADGNLDETKAIVDSGCAIQDQPVEDGYSLLHMACENGHVDLVQFLLDRGAACYLNTFDYLARTPLIVAARTGHLQIARSLLRAGADINAHDEGQIGNTAIRDATYEGRLEMVKLLLKHKADPTIQGWMQIDAVLEAKLQLEQDPSSMKRQKIYEILSPYKEEGIGDA